MYLLTHLAVKLDCMLLPPYFLISRYRAVLNMLIVGLRRVGGTRHPVAIHYILSICLTTDPSHNTSDDSYRDNELHPMVNRTIDYVRKRLTDPSSICTCETIHAYTKQRRVWPGESWF